MPFDRSPSQSLASIADKLGVPITEFFDPPSSAFTKSAELMRLWEAIPDDAGRDRLLALARELAARPVAPKKLAAE